MYSGTVLPYGIEFLDGFPPRIWVTDGEHQLPKHSANIVWLRFVALLPKYCKQDQVAIIIIDLR